MLAQLGEIDPALMKRVAAEDATNALPSATHNTVFLDRLHAVFAARGRETASRAEHRTNATLVKTDQQNKNASRQLKQLA